MKDTREKNRTWRILLAVSGVLLLFSVVFLFVELNSGEKLPVYEADSVPVSVVTGTNGAYNTELQLSEQQSAPEVYDTAEPENNTALPLAPENNSDSGGQPAPAPSTSSAPQVEVREDPQEESGTQPSDGSEPSGENYIPDDNEIGNFIFN